MKKKGFTLIELLAVIVILAIIALIATPIVMNTIENAKEGAAERSADNYIDAVETEVAKQRIDGVVLEGEYTIQSDGSLCPKAGCGENDKDKILIEMSGNKPSGGTIFIENGQVVDKLSTDADKKTTITIGDYDVSYDTKKEVYVAVKQTEEKTSTLCRPAEEPIVAKFFDQQNTTNWQNPIYLDAEVGLLAKDVENDYAYGVTYICNLGDDVERTFFILEDGDNNSNLIKTSEVLISRENSGRASTGEVTLIMDSNHDNDNMSWCSDNAKPYCNFAHISDKLARIRQSWKKLESSQINLPTYAQIYAANDSSDTITSISWLTGNISPFVSSGYWVSNINNGNSEEGSAATIVYWSGMVFGMDMTSLAYGIRPVITIPKTELGL